MTSAHTTIPLYKIVFHSRVVFGVVFVLCLSFLLQPFRFVNAEEIVTESVPVAEAALPDVAVRDLVEASVGLAALVQEGTTEPEVLHNDALPLLNNDASTEAVAAPLAPVPEEEMTTSSELFLESEIDTLATTTQSDELAVTIGVVDTPATITQSVESAVAIDVGDTPATTTQLVESAVAIDVGDTPTPFTEPEELYGLAVGSTTTVMTDIESVPASLPDDISTTSSATSSEIDAVLPLIHNSYNDNELRFERSQCTLVGDGSFYCQPLPLTTGEKDGLLAAPDSDGDLEIFLVKDGQYDQITSNLVDDASPYFDQLSDTIVWHRLVDDRYQLFAYDIKAGTESRVTTSQTHDMEPSRQGKYTVWQRWVGEYWQIMLSDGETEMQVSQTQNHNLSPFIRGQFIMWNTKNEEGAQQVQTYDMLTQTYTTINDDEDATMMNPRMMMVYEAVYENGDIMTRGFDMRTGKVVPLASLPREVPQNIPMSDSTGETKALINNKSSSGKDVDIETEPEPTPTSSPPLLPPGASSSSTPTLDLRISSTTEMTPVVGPPEVSDGTFDLIIEAEPSTQIEVKPE